MASLRVPSSSVDGLRFNCNSIQDIRSFPVKMPSIFGQRAGRFAGISINAAATTSFPQPYVQSQGLCNDRMEKMIYNSVNDIIQNLKEAPLLVQVFNDGVSKTERAESWNEITGKWNAGKDPVPEGIIFVEELADEEDDYTEVEDGGTKAWGVVVQGKGKECGGPQCFLLKTSRVRSGLGLFCTHFCLIKVKSFRKSAMSQLNSCWL